MEPTSRGTLLSGALTGAALGAGLPTAERLLSGEVDAAVMDGPAAAQLVRDHAGLRTMDSDLGAERYGLALPPDRAGLHFLVDEALARLEQSGWLERLDAKYGLESAEATEQGP